ncbi:hypothetical protein K7432_014117 [Basidiobolus ranarum]|uniref:Uncharacterized protein n=1 Tax=Basidiobolus ranarum TaxID=34480 RepID=A0ABR2WI48_9FUNG
MSANEESSRPTVAKAMYPAEGAGNQTFSSKYLLTAVIGIPTSLVYFFGLGISESNRTYYYPSPTYPRLLNLFGVMYLSTTEKYY